MLSLQDIKTILFQSRNRETFDFNKAMFMSIGDFTPFQSRNRETFDFNSIMQ